MTVVELLFPYAAGLKAGMQISLSAVCSVKKGNTARLLRRMSIRDLDFSRRHGEVQRYRIGLP